MGKECGAESQMSLEGWAGAFFKSTDPILWRLRFQGPRILLLDGNAMSFPPMLTVNFGHYCEGDLLPEFSIRIAQMALLHSCKRAHTTCRCDGASKILRGHGRVKADPATRRLDGNPALLVHIRIDESPSCQSDFPRGVHILGFLKRLKCSDHWLIPLHILDRSIPPCVSLSDVVFFLTGQTRIVKVQLIEFCIRRERGWVGSI
jgi:hypothetical protein